MSKKAALFLVGVMLGCGGGLPPRVEPELGVGRKRTGTRGPAAKKAKKEAEKRRIKRYTAPVPVTRKLDLLKHLRYEEYPQERDAPYKPGWTEPGETYPLDSVESVLENMRPVHREMASIVERRGAIEPLDYVDLRHCVGRLRMHADEIYRLKVGKDAGEVFVREKFAEASPSDEWCLKVMAGKLERATLLEATKELRKLWEEFKTVCEACKLDLEGAEEKPSRR